MLTMEWNALRIGDRVAVHDPDSPTLALVPGVVALVDMRRGANGVGIRVHRAGSTGVLWAPAAAVHRDPTGPAEDCWRCDG